MSQLAFNYKGQRFAPPVEAVYWRVRRLRDGQRGQLDVVRSGDGIPMIVPIEIGIEEFRAAVAGESGRYRLDALDGEQRAIEDVDAAYVTVTSPRPMTTAGSNSSGDEAVERDGAAGALRNDAPKAVVPRPSTVTAPFGTWPALPMPDAMSGTEYLLAEALRGQVRMFEIVTTALAGQTSSASAGAAQMMSAAADLVRAADGAAMPRRPRPEPVAPPPTGGPPPGLPPIVLAAPAAMAARNAASTGEDWEQDDDDRDDAQYDEDDGDDPAEPEEADVFAKMMNLADKVQGVLAPVADVARLVMGGMGDGRRNAAPAAEAGATEDGATSAGDDATAPDLAHLRASHVLLIAHELGPDGSLFRRLLMAMEPADRQAWTDRLCSMPFEDAVADAGAQLAKVKQRQASRRSSRAARSATSPVDADAVRDPAAETAGDADGQQTDAGQPAVHGSDLDGDERSPAGAGDQVSDGGEGEIGGDEDRGEIDPLDPPAPPATAPTTVPPPSPAAVQARMMEIAKHLRVPEILRAQKLIGEIVGAERDRWITRLMALSPPEAAQLIRDELARRIAR